MKGKKFIALTMLLFFTLLGSNFVGAVEPPKVFIDGEELVSDLPIVIEDNRTLVPMRAIFEALEQNVEWNNEERSVTSGSIWLQIDNAVAVVGDERVELDVPARIIQDSTYVPLRFIAQSLDKDVFWDGAERRADINSKILEEVIAEQLMEFEIDKVYYDEGILKADGTFHNVGSLYINNVQYIDVLIHMANEEEEQAVVADHRFENIPVELEAGAKSSFVFIFAGVPEYEDAVYWGFDAYDWELE
ncbi:copper amine oxidase N-terminal domain-containing protein [Heliorestis acidaminivorans]|uniref:Copper amine oxidase N-terminal domain-containing protein n=1 Tax=Heliorestis acidaminivorans TaxID=553427 RepID=A0A6I0EW82_9FIRM|nr:copper amine oxidase N-terminal domain-containing protein [Heliorestis acidaminivorans]KAB2952315.1 copper amine oxidase N-terminal domain-containing protein [Heliorestis acidaminivorans]